MSEAMKSLTDLIRKRLAFDEYAGMRNDYVAGREFENARILALLAPVLRVVEAAEGIGLQCLNTGMYGPLKISPGECKCSSCEMKDAIAALREG